MLSPDQRSRTSPVLLFGPLCSCRTFLLPTPVAYLDSCGFLHTPTQCPPTRWLTDVATWLVPPATPPAPPAEKRA